MPVIIPDIYAKARKYRSAFTRIKLWNTSSEPTDICAAILTQAPTTETPINPIFSRNTENSNRIVIIEANDEIKLMINIGPSSEPVNIEHIIFLKTTTINKSTNDNPPFFNIIKNTILENPIRSHGAGFGINPSNKYNTEVNTIVKI